MMLANLDAARELGAAPTTEDQLHEWLVNTLGVHVPRSPVLLANAAPFDYLRFSFLGKTRLTATAPTPTDCVVWSNRGGGKTFLGAVATLLDLVFRPGIEVRVLAGSLDQSKRMHAHLRRFFSPLFSEALAAEVDGKITERRLALKNGSSVELLAASQTSVRGTRVQKLRCDEVDLFTPELWEAAALTTRSKVCDGYLVAGSVECLSTMHVPHGVMHRLVREAHEGTRELFRWGVVDALGVCEKERLCGECPLSTECGGNAKGRPGAAGHISIADAVSLKRRVSLAAWESEMLCLRPRRTDSVFPEFDAREHVFAHAGPREEEVACWALGMDFGIRAPTAILWCAVGADGTLWVMDERVMADVVLDDHIAAIRAGLARDGVPAWPAPSFIAPDPAGQAKDFQTGTNAVAVLKQHGFDCRVSRAEVMDGVGLVRARLKPATGEPARLYVHERCRKLIEAMERYHYPPNLESLKPVKDGYDHAVDALRYLVQALDKPGRTVGRSSL